MLILAVIVLSLSNFALDSVPAGDIRFFSFFGLVGTLHATSIAVSLRNGTSLTLRIAFIAAATVLSGVTMLLAIVIAPELELIRSGSLRLFFFLALASALGASGYWLLVRWFWLKSLSSTGLIKTVPLCTAATLISWGVGMLIALLPWAWHDGTMKTTPGIIISDLPTAAWWAAFSGSLYWSELGGRRLSSSQSR